MELQTEIAGITLEHPVMNAAGTCKFLDDVKKLARSATAAINVGSITVDPRDGNSGDVYWAGGMYSLNSLGLPNRGSPYYKDVLPEMVQLAHDNGKPLFVSIAGFTPDEYAFLAYMCLQAGVDMITVNLGCPNVWEGGGQKRIACFDPNVVGQTLLRIEQEIGTEAKIAVKLSPFSDPYALGEIAGIISSSQIVKAVVAVNTFANAFSYNEEGRPRITPGGGLAGFAGRAMKPIGLGAICQLRYLLPSSIGLIGVGGVWQGQDVLDYVRCGARLTKVGTAYLERREIVFSDILRELIEILDD